MTLAVTDLDRSIVFYRDVLGLDLRARWNGGAYLEVGALWLCVSVDPDARRGPHPDYTHVAFDVADDAFPDLAARVREAAPEWKTNRSEGASLYFLDPDGHKLELHSGTMASRLLHWRDAPPAGLSIPVSG